MHELGHAIGFQHEHQRPDRDDYITVQLDSVGTDWKFAFNKLSWTHVDNRNIAYDYTSVMHYGLTVGYTGGQGGTSPGAESRVHSSGGTVRGQSMWGTALGDNTGTQY